MPLPIPCADHDPGTPPSWPHLDAAPQRVRLNMTRQVGVRTALLLGPNRPRLPGVDRLANDWEGCRDGGLHSAGKHHVRQETSISKEEGYLENYGASGQR